MIANGGLGDPEAARAVLGSGAADVVALGKGALAQRDWPHRVRDGLEFATEMRPDTLGPLADVEDWELAP
ncbi:hypothetical protein JL475_24735 [Streptomyces sp. M2CJ-2]|uniref:hypothetical protein n=1 Tax=Streptomyces sp. M2CJ-2 TaxID=2803948 RepID=UPI001926B3C6|nr:hypothetical protein [Streptomyces sp. M2CJ-2]MBL3669141.1 hypothetical protein [Streptomyces sp. M2CJ-2]